MDSLFSLAATRFCSLLSNTRRQKKTISKILLKHVVFHCTFSNQFNGLVNWSKQIFEWLYQMYLILSIFTLLYYGTIHKNTRFKEEMPGECAFTQKQLKQCKSNTSKVKISLVKVPFFLFSHSSIFCIYTDTHAQTDGRTDRRTHAHNQMFMLKSELHYALHHALVQKTV